MGETMKKIFILCMAFLMLMPCAWARHKKAKLPPQPTVLGIERVCEPEMKALFENKRIGVFTNQSGVNSKLEGSVDVLRSFFNVTSIFVPEHGLLGAVAAGEKFENEKYNGITVYSLYGGTRRPTKEMLDTIDAIVVDIQDVGVRHYTYTSSLAYIMEECAKYNKTIIVLDRPNPLGGDVQGPVLKPEHSSFIGLYTIPLRHGLTIGEFARYINTEEKINCPLYVVPMKNWTRNMLWKDTQLPWVQTSPLIPTAETAILYCVTGVCGDACINIGVGTAKPFHYVGGTFADADEVKKALDDLQIPGVAFRKAAYMPRYGQKTGDLVKGVEIYILDPQKVNLPELEYSIIYKFQELYPEKMRNYPQRHGNLGNVVDIALGEDTVEKHLPPSEVFPRWQQECDDFKEKIKPYLLYQ